MIPTGSQHCTALTQSKGRSNSHHSRMTSNANIREGMGVFATGRQQDCLFWKCHSLKMTSARYDILLHSALGQLSPSNRQTNHTHNTHCYNKTELINHHYNMHTQFSASSDSWSGCPSRYVTAIINTRKKIKRTREKGMKNYHCQQNRFMHRTASKCKSSKQVSFTDTQVNNTR